MTLGRILPAAVAGAVYLVLATLWLAGAHQPYMAFFELLGLEPFRFPFLDLHAILAAIECQRLGLDVYAINPCDALGRLHVYSPVWLHLAALPVTTAWTGPAGLILDALFLASLIMLRAAQRPCGVLLLVVASVSPPVAFALERANNDLVIFLLAVLAGQLVLRSCRLRLCGYLIIVFAAALKFYPVAMLVLTQREPRRRCVIITLVMLAILAACLLPEQASLRRALDLMPSGEADTFGAINVPAAFVRAMHWPAWTRRPIEALLIIVMTLKAIDWSHRLQPGLNRLPEAHRVFLTIGAALIVGCFLTGQSAGYRAIFLLLVLPALLVMADDRDNQLPRIVIGSMLAVMWTIGLPFDRNYVFRLLWMVDQYAWWFIVTALSAMLLAILRDSAAMKPAPRGSTYDGLAPASRITAATTSSGFSRDRK